MTASGAYASESDITSSSLTQIYPGSCQRDREYAYRFTALGSHLASIRTPSTGNITSSGRSQRCLNIRKIRIRIRIHEYSTNSNFRNWPKNCRIEFELEFEFSFGNEFEYKSNSSQGRIFANIRSEFVYDNRSICESHPVCHHSVVQTVFDFL
jgi:hypothetical protein